MSAGNRSPRGRQKIHCSWDFPSTVTLQTPLGFPVPLLDCVFGILRERIEHLLEVLWLADHNIGNEVHQREELFSRSAVIAEIDQAGVDRIVSDHAYHVERLLNSGI